jgi:hypothetical protein
MAAGREATMDSSCFVLPPLSATYQRSSFTRY